MKKDCCETEFGEPCTVECLRKLNERKPVHHVVSPRYGHWRRDGSDSMAVLPHQVKQAVERDKEVGAPPVEYKLTSDGFAARPHFTSIQNQRKWLKAHKLVNYDSYN